MQHIAAYYMPHNQAQNKDANLPYILDYKNHRIIRTTCLNDQFCVTFIVLGQLTPSDCSQH